MDFKQLELSIRQRCRLAEISRSGWYYEAKPEAIENLRLMRLIDEQIRTDAVLRNPEDRVGGSASEGTR